MTTEDFIITLFCLIDDRMGAMEKHRQARLWPSELVTIGVLFALKGGYFRAFYRWLERDYAELFGGVPERTRLQRLLAAHADEPIRDFVCDGKIGNCRRRRESNDRHTKIQ